MKSKSIYQIVNCERKYQDQRWGKDFDNKNTASDWAAIITRYAAEAVSADAGLDGFQFAMFKIAAVAVAAIETSERNDGLPPRHYEE